MNCFTQFSTGACASYENVEKCFVNLREWAVATEIKTIAMPAIGCGIGGLDFDKVLSIAMNNFAFYPIEVYLFRPH